MSSSASVSSNNEEAVLVGKWEEEWRRVQEWVQPHFARPETRASAEALLQGLLARVERKNSWGLSEEAGRRTPYAFQHLLNGAQWDEEALRDDVLTYARQRLGEGGVLAVDETGFLKEGDKSAGVARQYSGTAGRIENCQTGVFLAYVTDKGLTLVDREMYVPEDWFEKPESQSQRYVLAVASNTYAWRGEAHVTAGEVLKEVKTSEVSPGTTCWTWALVRMACSGWTRASAPWVISPRAEWLLPGTHVAGGGAGALLAVSRSRGRRLAQGVSPKVSKNSRHLNRLQASKRHSQEGHLSGEPEGGALSTATARHRERQGVERPPISGKRS